MALTPLRDGFLFEFANDTAEGLFIEKSKFGFILTNQDVLSQGQFARWGKVASVGPDVKDFGVGDYVLIESGMWTTGFKYEDTKLWKSDAKRVCAIGVDESVTFAY